MLTTLPLTKPFIRCILTVGFVVLLSRPAWPVTIELNTGQIITGTVISQDKDSYKIDTGIGFPLTYFIDEIKAIDGEPVSPPAAGVQEEELSEPAETKNEDAGVPSPPPQPAVDERESITEEAGPVPTPIAAESPEAETAETIPSENIQDTVQLEGFAIEEFAPEAKSKPMAQVIADEINQMMIKNNSANIKDEPVLRSDPETNLLDEPAKDVSEIEAGIPLKEHPSPFGPTIKPREDQNAMDDLAAGKNEGHPLNAGVVNVPQAGSTAASVTGGKSSNALFTAVDNYLYTQRLRLNFAQDSFRQKLPHIKEKLYQLPVRVRRDALVVILCVFAAMYIVVCYPLMHIARKLGKRHSWLIWIPVVQLVYFIYMAGKPLWWTVFWAVPVVNYFMLLLLFVDILKAMNKRFWLIILIILPGVNIFALWYLAISQEFQLKGKQKEIISPILR